VFYVCLSSGACHGSGLMVTIGSEIVRVWAIRLKMKIRCEDLMMLREKIRELDVEGWRKRARGKLRVREYMRTYIMLRD
jgi:hypothetical protein